MVSGMPRKASGLSCKASGLSRKASGLSRGGSDGSGAPASPATVQAPPGSAGGVQDAIKGPHPAIAYWDPNRVRIAVKRPDGSGKVTIFTFERKALFTWKLVHIRLPSDERQG